MCCRGAEVPLPYAFLRQQLHLEACPFKLDFCMHGGSGGKLKQNLSLDFLRPAPENRSFPRRGRNTYANRARVLQIAKESDRGPWGPPLLPGVVGAAFLGATLGGARGHDSHS